MASLISLPVYGGYADKATNAENWLNGNSGRQDEAALAALVLAAIGPR